MMKKRICTWCDGLGYVTMRDKTKLIVCPYCNGSGMEEYFSHEDKKKEKPTKRVSEKSI